MERTKSKIIFGQRFNLGWLLLLVLVFASGLALTQTANADAMMPCAGADYSECSLDYGGIKKGICLAGFCNTGDSGYRATKKYCAEEAAKYECVLPKVESDGYAYFCGAKEEGAACTISSCVQNPLGVPYSGCTNAAEKCAGTSSYARCAANTACPDTDRDGIPLCWAPGQYTKWDTPVPPPKKDLSRFSDDSGIGDCDDKDPYSYGYSSANIASVSFTPINRNYPVGNFSPLDGVSLTVNFKKKCGHTIPTPPGVPLYVSLVFSPTQKFTLSGSSPTTFVKKSDFVYTADIGFNSYLTEELIAAIVKNPKPKLKFLGADEFTATSQDKSFNNPTLPMTNCAQVYGGGKHKVVYMRDNTSVYGQILDWSRYGITGFTTVEPLKKYQTEFSHFVDLRKYDYGFASIQPLTIRKLRETSSCGFWNSMYFGIYLDKASKYGVGNGWVNSRKHMGAAIIQVGGYEKLMSYMLIHEFGHAFANLSDEYYDPRRNIAIENEAEIREFLIPHCSLDPAQDYSAGGKLYGGKNFESCTIASKDPGFPERPKIFRPSLDSIMHQSYLPLPGYAQGSNTENFTRFNVVSCAHVIKNIKDSPTHKQHFAECAAMPGIVPVGE